MLSGMQEKLLVGGQVLDRAAKQEEELRRAQLELEERKRQVWRRRAGCAPWIVKASVFVFFPAGSQPCP